MRLMCMIAVLVLWAAVQTQASAAWEFNGPFGIAVDSRGVVYVAEIGNRRIAKFTTEGEWLGVIDTIEGYGPLGGPFDVAVGAEDELYIADTLNHQVLALDRDGKLRFVLGTKTKGAKQGEFAQPHFVTVNDAGEIFVSDTFNARVQKFSPQGKFMKAWGRVGSGPGEFLHHGYLASIDLDGNGFLYVREFDGGRIQKFTEDGQYIATFSQRGSGDGQLDEGYGLTVIDGKLYCPDTFASRVQIFSLNGELLDIWAPGEGNSGEHFNHPVDIAQTPDGQLVMTDWKNNRVVKLDQAGKFVATWGQSLDAMLAYEPPVRYTRSTRRPIRIGIYAGTDDATLKQAADNGVDVIYPSLGDQYGPWFIASAVEKAASLGIEIHPSVACLPFGQGQSANSDVFIQNPQWCLWKKGANGPLPTIMSWAHRGARDFRSDHIVEQVLATGAQGVMLDYIRYLGTDYGYDPVIVDGFFKKYGQNPLDLPQDDLRWMQYRADFVTDFIVELRQKLAVQVPDRTVEISVYLSGDDPTPGIYLTSSLQDWRTWARMGIVDTVHVAPYTRDFKKIYDSVRRVREAVPERVNVNCFIASYGGNLNTPALLKKGFDVAIAAGADQVTVYRGDAINELNLYPTIGEVSRSLKELP